MNNAISRAIDTRRKRRQYALAQDEMSDLHDELYTEADAGERATLLERLADTASRLAQLHATLDPRTIARGDDWQTAGSLTDSAQLYRLVAATERTVATSQWTPAADLRAGNRIWHQNGDRAGWCTITDTRQGVLPTMVRADLQDGSARVFADSDLVRTDGPYPPVVFFADADADVAEAELALWVQLAATCDRMARAGLLRQINKFTAERVGEDAADVLAEVADTETRLADGDPGRLPDMAAARVAIGIAFLFLGALIAAPAVARGADPRQVLAVLAGALAVAAAVTVWRWRR